MDQTIEDCSSRANSSDIDTLADTNTIINDEATLNITVSMNNSASENQTALSRCVFNQSETDVDMNQINAFVAILRISQLKKEDEQYVHRLTITNELGTTFYDVRITHIEGKGKVQKKNLGKSMGNFENFENVLV